MVSSTIFTLNFLNNPLMKKFLQQILCMLPLTMLAIYIIELSSANRESKDLFSVAIVVATAWGMLVGEEEYSWMFFFGIM